MKTISTNDPYPLREEAGWQGAFLRSTAQGAIPNGATVFKANSEHNDAHPDGTPGVVLGSMSHPKVQDGAIMYFVEWVKTPKVAVAVMGNKLRRLQ